MQNLTIDALLDRVREAQGLKSDYQMAKVTGFSIQKIGNWRHGRVLPDEKACQTLAVAAGLDPYVVIAQVHALRTKDSAARAIWERIAERLQVAAHGLAAAIFSVLIATEFVATDASAASAATEHTPAPQVIQSVIHRIELVALLFAGLAFARRRKNTAFFQLAA